MFNLLIHRAASFMKHLYNMLIAIYPNKQSDQCHSTTVCIQSVVCILVTVCKWWLIAISLMVVEVLSQLDKSYSIMNQESALAKAMMLETFAWSHSNETYEDDCRKKTRKISQVILDMEFHVL